MTYEATGDAVNGHRRASRGRAARKLTPTAAAPAIVDGPPALRDPAALLRNADWPRLPAVERAALLAPYAGLALPVAADGPDLRETADDAALRAWVADLVAQRLQGAAAGSLRAWLEDGTPNSHLYISGSPGRARTSVVATFARRALRRQPASPDYCYVPDPTALGHCWLLALAAGTGMPFAEALISAMRAILLNWEKPRERLRIASDDEPDETVLRARMVAASLGAIVDTVPTAVRPYLDRLSAALTAVCANSIPPVVAEIDVPAGRIQLPALDAATIAALPLAAGTAAEPAADPHPPVIVSSLSRMDLTRSLLRANGGVLVLLAADFVDRDQVTSELATLRGVLRAGMVYARGAGEPGIPITTRVVLIGSYVPFRVLERAEEFVRLFRYKIRFDEDTDWVPESEAAYAALLAGVAEYYHLPPFDPTAVGRVVEEGARRASHYHREHLTADLPALRDLAVEAGKLALARHATPSARSTRAARADAATSAAAPATRRAARTAAPLATTAADVEAAIAARRTLQSGQGRLAREMVLSNHEIVPTVGAAVGQINGLGVSISLPVEGRFAIPFRISAAVSPGAERLVDIEREAETADSSHISGTLTMAGYLAWRYGRQRPISVVARLRFEQEHDYTSGPSASAAELFALLSALADVPLRQSLAVTGAMGQHGELQLIGGVNEKIEGFWEICRARRARGERPEGPYGVLIPLANADDLMLRPAVVASIVEEGWFHVWPIPDVDAGLPLLTGLPAATIHARVDRQLREFYELARRPEVLA